MSTYASDYEYAADMIGVTLRSSKGPKHTYHFSEILKAMEQLSKNRKEEW